ncbi:hypothetical protein EDB89DRAFT_2239701 [Lactarius sanguifluus]|nr:hypothetical protein EDB89DRAFT_2239701 [Lactarius sanguifluus]
MNATPGLKTMRLLARMGARRVARRVVMKPMRVFDLRWRMSSCADSSLKLELEAGPPGSKTKRVPRGVVEGADPIVADVFILAPKLAREGGKGLRNVEESRNEGRGDDDSEREVTSGGSWRLSRGIDEVKEGVTSRVEQSEPTILNPGGRCGGVEWRGVGTTTEASCCAGRRGMSSPSDEGDTRGFDDAGVAKGSSTRLQHDSPGDGCRDGSEWTSTEVGVSGGGGFVGDDKGVEISERARDVESGVGGRDKGSQTSSVNSRASEGAGREGEVGVIEDEDACSGSNSG